MSHKKILAATAFCFFIYFLPQNIFSDNIEKANKYYEKYDYKFAIDIYEKLMAKKPSLAIAEKLANCYRFTNNTGKAEEAYARVLSYAEAAAINYKYYADALKQNARFSEAKKNYLLYAEKAPDFADYATKMANACDAAKMWAENPEPNVSVENQLALNSEYSEFSPVKYKSGFAFVSDRWFVQQTTKKDEPEVYGWTGNPYLKLYSSDGSNAPKIEMLPQPVNNDSHTGPAVFSASGDTLYFSRSVADENKKGKGKIIGRTYIYTSVKAGDRWSEPVAIPFNTDASFSVQHPALSPDGGILYFASDMPGGRGGTDLYASRKNAAGSWSNPVNCGNAVNSVDDEGFPYVRNDGKLYFSSKGHVGMGGLDIFSATGSYNNFGPAENLKSPYNSSKDDFGILFLDNQSGFISSNRNGGRGLDDIYKFSISKPTEKVQVLAVEGRVFDKETTQPLNGLMVNLINTETGEKVSVLSDVDGKFRFDLKPGQNYVVKGNDDRFFTRQEGAISTKGLKESTTFNVRFDLERSDAAYLVRLNDIYYDFDRWNIRPEAANELNRVVSFLGSMPNVNIEMRAHTDARGKAAYNLALSQKRAQAAVDFLRDKGIEAGRYNAVGLGETQLLNSCSDQKRCSDQEHQLNRRTEFKVVKVKSAESNVTASLSAKK